MRLKQESNPGGADHAATLIVDTHGLPACSARACLDARFQGSPGLREHCGAYTVNALLAVVRIACWWAVLFGFVPRLVFGRRDPVTPGSRVFDDVVRTSFAAIVIVHLLVVLHLFDVVSLVAAFVVVAVAHARFVRHVAPLAELRSTWRATVTWTLNLLDERIDVRQVARARAAGVRRMVRSLISNRLGLGWTVAFLAVMAATAWLRLGDALRHPSSDLGDYGIHLAWFKALGSNRLYVDGVYPYGAEAMLQVTRRLVALDESLIMRVAPGMLECVVAATVYWTVRRLGGRRGPAVVGASLFGIFAFAGWLPAAPTTGDVLGIDIALVVLLPTLVFATEALVRDRDRVPALFMQSIACLFLLHPFVGLVGLVALGGVTLAGIGVGRVRIRSAVSLTFAAVGAAALGCVPLVAGLGFGDHVLPGGLPPDKLFFGLALRSPDLLAPLPPTLPVLVAGATITAVVVLALATVQSSLRRVAPGPGGLGASALAGASLAVVALSLPTRFDLPELLAPAEVARVLAPLACATVAMGADQAWDILGSLSGAARRRWLLRIRARSPRRFAGWPELVVTIGVLSGLVLATLPLRVPVGDRPESDAVVTQLYRIKSGFAPQSWTAVGSQALLPQVTGPGYFMDQEQFVRDYRPELWHFDPLRPDLAVPTREVFVFVRMLPDSVPRFTGLDAAVGLDPSPLAPEIAARPGLLAWVEQFRQTHTDLTTYYASRELTVFHIHRSPEEEREGLRQMNRQKSAGR